MLNFLKRLFGGGGKPAPASPTRRPEVAEPAFRRLVVNPEYDWARLAGALARIGLELDGDPGDDPDAATWYDRDGGKVTFQHVRDLRLLKLEMTGPDPRGLVQAIVSEAYVSTMESKMTDFLDPARPARDLRYGINGAEWIGIGENHKFYWEKVGALRDHADPAVAADARRAYDALLAQAPNGKPIPSGPRGLPLEFAKQGDELVAKYRGVTWTLRGDTLFMDGKEYLKIDGWPDAWTK